MLLTYKSFRIKPHKRVEKYLQKPPINERKKLIEKIDALVTDDYQKLKIIKLKALKTPIELPLMILELFLFQIQKKKLFISL